MLRRNFNSLLLTAPVAPGLQPATPSLSPWQLWYAQPATDWNEALPIGNGRLGAMVHGGFAEEHLQLNDDTLASSAPGVDNLPLDVTKQFDEVVALLRGRQSAEHAGEIHLLPALPQAWNRGRVKGLVARGGYEVAMEWEGGSLKEAVLHSRLGGECRLRYTDKAISLNTRPGGRYRLSEALEVRSL